MATIERFGDWDLVGLITRNLQKDMAAAGVLSVRRFAAYAERTAKLHMSKQDLAWAPLNPAYQRRKVRQGFSPNILIRTSTYFQAITSYVEDKGLTGLAGVRREAKDKEGNSLANIAKVQEYGSIKAGIPARPLWGPVYEETVKWHVENNAASKIFIEETHKKYHV